MQATLLIKEHKQAYDALIDVLKAGGGVGDAIIAIEDNLPSELPSRLRASAKKERKKKSENEQVKRYILNY